MLLSQPMAGIENRFEASPTTPTLESEITGPKVLSGLAERGLDFKWMLDILAEYAKDPDTKLAHKVELIFRIFKLADLEAVPDTTTGRMLRNLQKLSKQVEAYQEPHGPRFSQ